MNGGLRTGGRCVGSDGESLIAQNEVNTQLLLGRALRADQGAVRETQIGQEALDRRTEDAQLSLGEIDDHLRALAELKADVLGHEFDSLAQIADRIEDIHTQLEGLL